jgi:Cadherin-like domain/Bacterial Ig domain
MITQCPCSHCVAARVGNRGKSHSKQFTTGRFHFLKLGSTFKASALVAVGLAASLAAHATEFYVSPTGSASGSGSASSPWDLQTALNQPASVKPGDTIWLRGGVHRQSNRPTKFTSKLTGTSSAPITVRQYPGERATVDGNISQYTGGYVNYWGFEIMDSQQFGAGNAAPTRTSTQSGPFPTTWWATYDGKQIDFCVSGIDLRAPNCKLINIVLHDNIGGGLGMDTAAGDTEVYGLLSYYNGWQGSDRGHGHGIYAQNIAPAIKYIEDSLVFDNYALGMQATGAGPDPIADNFTVEGSAFFLNGAVANSHQQNLLIGPFQGQAMNPVVRTNFIYDNNGTSSDFFLGYDGGSKNAICQGNYFQTSTMFNNNANMTLSGNTFLSGTIGLTQSSYPNNTYQTTKPTKNVIAVRPNKYESGRANILVYNWENLNSVSVDVSKVLPVGTAYEVRNAQDFYGTPVTKGIYNGGSISLPTMGLSVAKPVGANAPGASGPAFNAYVLLPTSSVTNTPPGNTNAAPVISTIPNQTLTAGKASAPIPFTVSDDQTAASSLTLAGTSYNQTLVPDANIVFGGSGSNRTVTVTPAANQSGTANITITVNDGSKLSTSSFTVTVTATPANVPPVISSISAQTTTTNKATAPIPFTVSDAETAASNLKISGTSSNPTLVPNANIVFGGSSSNRTVTVTPAANQSGTANITVSVNDGSATSSTTFALTVTAPATPPQVVTIPLEAEAGNLVAPMTVYTNAQNSSVRYVASPTAEQGSVTFIVNIPVAGTYYIWGRVLSPSYAADSFYVSVDGGAEDVYDDAEGIQSPNWQWTAVNGRGTTGQPLALNPRKFTLTQGTHSIKFRGREANATLDRIIISNDPTFVPKDITASNVTLTANGNATTQFTAKSLQGTNNLFLDNVLVSVSSPYTTQGGTVSTCDGGILYTPKSGFTGSDTFTFTLTDGSGNSSTATATVNVQAPATRTASIPLQKQADGSMQVVLKGTPGTNYNLQVSTDLKTWVTLGQVSAGTDGLIAFTDNSAAGSQSKFYRTI